MAVALFRNAEEATDPCRVVDGNRVLQYLESNRERDIRELSCSNVALTTEDVIMMDALLRQHHQQIHLEKFTLSKTALTSESASSLSRIIESNHGSLRHVDLSYNPLLGDPTALSSLVEAFLATQPCPLQYLDLTHTQLKSCSTNSLGTLLSSLLRSTNLPCLTTIKLGQNNLGKCIKSLSSTLCNENHTLLALDVSDNKLKDKGVGLLAPVLDPNVSTSILCDLDLSNNQLHASGIEKLVLALQGGEQRNRTLQRLDVSRNDIGPNGAFSLAQWLRHTYTLEELNLSACGIGDQGVTFISDSVVQNEGLVLKRLDLNSNSIFDDGANGLAQVVEGNSTLQSLRLANNGIGNDGAVAFAQAIPADLALRELDMSQNHIADAGAAALAKVLSRPKCQVNLQWDENRLSEDGDDLLKSVYDFRESMAGWLGEELRRIEERQMVRLDLASKPVGVLEISELSSKLVKHEPIVSGMYMAGRRINGNAIQPLAKDVLAPSRVDLQRLSIQNTSMGDLGAAALAQGLYANTILRNLSLVSCQITSEGAYMLANALRRNSTLTRVDLRDNRIGDDAARDFLSAILDPPHSSLISLNLASNGLSDDAFVNLACLVRLEELHLAHNQVTDRGALDLAKACMDSKNLRWLDLRDNRLSRKGIQALALFLPRPNVLDSHKQRHSAT